MELSQEQLAKIEEYASYFLAWQQIAVLLDIPEREFKTEMENCNSLVYRSYLKGKTSSQLEINKNLVRLAKLGSPQAELLIKDDINKQQLAENDL
jgi:hypothetical protein